MMTGKGNMMNNKEAIKGVLIDIRDFINEFGEAGWITLMVLGFIAWWPLGLAVIAYMVHRKKTEN